MYVCEMPGCDALATQRTDVVRREVGRYLAGEDAECAAITELVIDELLSCAFQDEPGPMRLQVERRASCHACWIELSGCSERMARWAGSPHRCGDLRLLVLDTVCAAWGAVAGDRSHTLWAEVPLVPQD